MKDRRLLYVLSIFGVASFLFIPSLILLRSGQEQISRPSDYYTAMNLAAEMLERTLASRDDKVYSFEQTWAGRELEKFRGEMKVTPMISPGGQEVSLLEAVVSWHVVEGNVVDTRHISLVSIKGDWPGQG